MSNLDAEHGAEEDRIEKRDEALRIAEEELAAQQAKAEQSESKTSKGGSRKSS